MKGVVLKFDAATLRGAIRAENNLEYGFIAPEWKGRGAPKPGAPVDFMTDGAAAVGIYPLPPQTRVAVPPPAYAPAPATPAYGAPAAGRGFVFRPALVISLAILGGCFLPLFDFPGQTVDGNSILGMYERLSALVASFNARTGQSLGLAHLLYAAYLIPLLAGWVFISELTNRGGMGASPTMRVLAGFWAFVAPVLLLVVLPQFATLEATPPPFGIGGLIILGGGCLLLLNVAGLIPTPQPRPV